MFSRPDYSTEKNFLNPRLGPWTVVLYLHRYPILRAIQKAAPLLRGRLLDVGCGIKPYANILQASNHVGLEVASSLHNSEHVDMIYDGQTLPFKSAEFDSVICTEVLEHCLDPQRVVSEIARVLRLGGKALITVPMMMHHHEVPRDFHRFTRYGVEQLVTQNNLDIIWIKPRGGVYSVALSSFYTALEATLSRRPFIDMILWFLWPISFLVLIFEKIKKDSDTSSLGWQLLVQKDTKTNENK